MISSIVGCNYKKATRAYNYCVGRKYFEQLGRGGRVRKAQAITMKRLQTTRASQGSWHNCISAAFDEHH
eukprot:4821733-Ditylum_brightwellii.AAC.1